jgi:hypothetical protein
MHRLGSLVLTVALLPACFHTNLAPVSPTMPPDQRGAAYMQLRPVQQEHTVTVTSSRNGISVVENDELILGNGETITHADDLLPVVAPQSPAAAAATRSRDARHHKYTAWLLGTAAVVVGTVMMIDGLDSHSESDYRASSMNEAWAGVGVATIGALVGYGAAWYFQFEEHRERRAAFATYDDGLRAQLDLCVSGLNVVPCEAPAPAAAPPAPPVPPAPVAPATPDSPVAPATPSAGL